MKRPGVWVARRVSPFAHVLLYTSLAPALCRQLDRLRIYVPVIPSDSGLLLSRTKTLAVGGYM